MVQVLPQRTNLGTQLGQSTGQGLAQGLQRGGEIGFQKNLLQNAFKDIENIPKDSNAFQLASKLIQATAGIPGAERYVGQLFPLLLGQLRSQQAFGQEGQNIPGQSGVFGEGVSPALGQSSQGLNPNLPQGKGEQSGGILGSIIPQDQIDAEAKRYAQATGTGLEGYNQIQANLMNRNSMALQQRQIAEQKASDIGIPTADIPVFMQIGQRYKDSKTFDDWVKKTERDFREYKNLSTTLDKFSYPGLLRELTSFNTPESRQNVLKRLDPQIKRLVDLGFEQEVRQKLSDKMLSPTEIEERIHPLPEKTQHDLSALPKNSGSEKSDERLRNFLDKSITSGTSLLVLRDRLWNEKNYDWQKIAKIMNEVISKPGFNISAAQQNELATLETEAPRQSLGYIFQDWGNMFRSLRGEK